MKIKKRSKINKPLVATIFVVAVSLVAFAIYLIYKPQSGTASKATNTNEISTDKQQSESLHSNPENKEKAPNTDHPSDPVSSTESGKRQVQMVASVDRSGDTVFIRGGINYPVSEGSCYALLSGPSGQSIRRDSTLLPNPASTDCKTISIPVNELVSGKWTLKLHYTSIDYEGTSSEVPFSI